MKYRNPKTNALTVDITEGSTQERILIDAGYLAAPDGKEVAPAQVEPQEDGFSTLPQPLNQQTIAPTEPAVANAPATDDPDDGTLVKGRASAGLKTTRGK